MSHLKSTYHNIRIVHRLLRKDWASYTTCLGRRTTTPRTEALRPWRGVLRLLLQHRQEDGCGRTRPLQPALRGQPTLMAGGCFTRVCVAMGVVDLQQTRGLTACSP